MENFLPTYAELNIHEQVLPHFKEEALKKFLNTKAYTVEKDETMEEDFKNFL